MNQRRRPERAAGVTVLGRLAITAAGWDAVPLTVSVDFEHAGRSENRAEAVLLGVHYLTHVLARFPRSDPELDSHGMALREMVASIIEQGVWIDSDLVRYAGLSGRLEVAESVGTGSSETVTAVLLRSHSAEDLDVVLETPASLGNERLVLTAIAVLQALVAGSSEPEIELLDRALRYVRTYIGEGVGYADPAAARRLANRAFRRAGGVAV